MIQTTTLLPPAFGPLANPLLFGVAEGLSMLFPLAPITERDTATSDGETDTVDGARREPSPRSA